MTRSQITPILGTSIGAALYGYISYILFTGDYFTLDAFSWSFIMLIPYAIGVITVYFSPEKFHDSLLYALLMPWASIAVLFLLALVVSFGMLLCLIFSLPYFLPNATLGGLSVWLIRRQKRLATSLLIIAALLPYLGSPVEAQLDAPHQLTTTHTQISINADPATIWAEIASVDPITKDEQRFNWLHLVGLPRPVAATLSEHRLGGVRDASFEHGLHFDETITRWEENEHLHFTIRETSQNLLPPPLNLIDGERFDVIAGRYDIEPQADGTVILHLTSDHYLQSRFNRYGSFWTDYIMRDLQNYILRILKDRAEAAETAS
ncbi:MAG TPA: hypothetical protein VLL52_01590 [Anaerolineae bacterium]|nr:hypothetical protein [Anaerolineae bacterium]